MQDRNQKTVEDYLNKKPLYDALTKKVETLIEEILNYEGIVYQSITSRTKDINSYTKKAQQDKYINPITEIFDISGVRVILYTESDARRVFQLLTESFDMLLEHTVDKSEELGVDRFGYRSLHCVGKFTPERLSLPEFSMFKDLCFEIQVRTILQHAWAEFEHDRNYKFSGVLPSKIKRRLSILAGILELTDNEFDKISADIDAYAKDVSKKTEKGILNIELTSISISDYMTNKFERLISQEFFDHNMKISEEVINQLKMMGVNNLADLDNIIPADYIEKILPIAEILKHEQGRYNFDGILFDLMVINNVKKFFEIRGIPSLTELEIKLYESYGIDKKILRIMRKHAQNI